MNIGLWGILEPFVAGVGWIGFGLFLRRERPAIGITTQILGISALAVSAGSAMELNAIATPGTLAYLVLAPLWALWLGIDLLRKPVSVETSGLADAEMLLPRRPAVE